MLLELNYFVNNKHLNQEADCSPTETEVKPLCLS